MRERPILFSALMVRAILEGRKTVTRRVVKPTGADHITPFIGADNRPTGEFGWCPHPCLITKHIRPPYQAGDRLWVRETWSTWSQGFDDGAHFPVYKADPERSEPTRWYPSIHMPKEFARIWLEVTAVRVELLQDITAEQASAEGAMAWASEQDTPIRDLDPGDERIAFMALWDSLAKPGMSWAENPWVWVVEFKRIEQEVPNG